MKKIPRITHTIYPKARLTFLDSGFPSTCNPQVPKKISLRLTGFDKSLGTPVLLVRLWAEDSSATKPESDGKQRASLESKFKKREGTWGSAITPVFKFTQDTCKKDEYTWNSFLQFTQLSYYNNICRRKSPGRMMILFYIREASPGSKQELMLKTPLVTVTSRQSKTLQKKEYPEKKLKSSTDLFIEHMSDGDLGREIKKAFAMNKNRKLQEVIEALGSKDVTSDLFEDSSNGSDAVHRSPTTTTSKRIKFTPAASPAPKESTSPASATPSLGLGNPPTGVSRSSG